jgi:magnesium transporter
MNVHTLLSQVDSLLAQKDDLRLRSLLGSKNVEDIARVITQLDHGKRKTFALLPPEMQADVCMHLPAESREYVLPRLSDASIARFLHFCEEDDAADLLQILPEHRRQTVLAHLKTEKRTRIAKLLAFDPESAGGLMDLNFVTIGMSANLKQIMEIVRGHLDLHRASPLVVVVDAQGKARGFIPHKSLMFAPQTATALSIMLRLPTVPSSLDQEKMLKIAGRERCDVFGVVDDADRFLGVVHLHDLLRIAQLEATEDVYKFAGVSTEENMLDSPFVAIRNRYSWLIINLATAFLAASVVSLFSTTIGRFALLAVYMPIVAGMGGNAGTQTLAIVVRGLALSDISAMQKTKLIFKEIFAGAANGLINGLIVASVILLLKQPPMLAAILASAMIINLVAAGIAGAVIPLALRSLKIDPAVSSTVFVTTVTDCVGFFAFLGLATLFLH